MVTLPAIILLLHYFLKPANSWLLLVDIALFGGMVLLAVINVKELQKRVFIFSCLAALFTGFYLNTVFFKEIAAYRGEIAAAEYVNQKPFNGFPVYSLKTENNGFQFYCRRPVNYLPIEQFDKFNSTKAALFYVNQLSMDYLVQSHARFTVLHSFITYPQENIMPKFINKTTRHEVLGYVYLITKPVGGGF